MTRPRIMRLQRRVEHALAPYRGMVEEQQALRALNDPQRHATVAAATRGIDVLQNSAGRRSDDFEGAVE